MTEKDCWNLIATALPSKDATMSVNRDGDARMVSVSFSESVDTSYDKLAALSAVLGTTEISFKYTAEHGGWELTPGDPSEFTLTIRMKERVTHAFVVKPDSAPRGKNEPPGQSCAICGYDPHNIIHKAES